MKQAFSLVELSIVLVILGLLTGGILAGQSLIRAAELRSVTTEYQRYVTAVQSFRDKYMALPGDMPNATSFWGAAHTTPATCRTTASTSALTCNGNGDGIIIDNGTTSNESYRFWQQLASAGLIEGSYSGITQGTSTFSSTAANSPASKIGRAYWFAWNWQSAGTGVGFVFDTRYNNFLALGALQANSWPGVAVLKPEEAWNIDTKIDDGKPGIGKMLAFGNDLSACTTATGAAAAQSASLNADYLLTATGTTCGVIMRDLF